MPGGLAYYRARSYDPGVARFVSEDPLEPWHYRYAENSPLRFVDPSGEVALITYALFACDAIGNISFGASVGAFFEEAITQAANGLKGEPGDVQKILEKLEGFFRGLDDFCGIPNTGFF
jgi:uncharacterized protein RhaS with RHS repeats